MSERTSEELMGKVAVVTGSSSGIGRAIALELAAAGADVIVHASKNRAGAQSVAAEIERLGRRSRVIQADFIQLPEQDALVDSAWQWLGKVDIWINNAGFDALTGEPARWSYEKKLEALWKVDVLATMRLSRAVGGRMKARGSGAIINIGWDQAEHGMAGDSGELFAATKGAVMAFSKSLAMSLAPEVRVNCLAPGWIKTAWGEDASAGWQQRAKEESLLGRWGTAEDVARVARFLASPSADFVTGQVLPVNGGFRRR